MPRVGLVSGTTLARLLEIEPGTVCAWRKAGIIPCIRVNCRVIHYDVADVLDALKERAKHPRPPLKVVP